MTVARARARNTDHGDIDFLRAGVRLREQALMEAEVSEQIGADHSERNSDGRSAQRNGYRDRACDTRGGTVRTVGPSPAGRTRPGRAGSRRCG